MTKKFRFSILYTVLSLCLVGCTKDSGKSIEGSYTLSSQSVQINGTIINMGDYPDNSVKIVATGDNTAEVTVMNLLPGDPALRLNCEVSGSTRSSGNRRFSGSDTSAVRTLGINGTVRKGNLSLAITLAYTTDVVNRWMLAEKNGHPSIRIGFSNPMITNVPIDGQDIPIEKVIEKANLLLPGLISSLLPLDYLEFDKGGFVNAALRENHAQTASTTSPFEPFMKGTVQYYLPADGTELHFYLRKTLAGILQLSQSPFDFAAVPTCTKDRLQLLFNEKTSKPVIREISKILSNFTYESYLKAGSPLGETTEENFNKNKNNAVLFVNALMLPNTRYELEVNMIPHVGRKAME